MRFWSVRVKQDSNFARRLISCTTGITDEHMTVDGILKQQFTEADGRLSWEKRHVTVEPGSASLTIAEVGNESPAAGTTISLRGVKYAKEWSFSSAVSGYGFDLVWFSGQLWSFMSTEESECRRWVDAINTAIAKGIRRSSEQSNELQAELHGTLPPLPPSTARMDRGRSTSTEEFPGLRQPQPGSFMPTSTVRNFASAGGAAEQSPSWFDPAQRYRNAVDNSDDDNPVNVTASAQRATEPLRRSVDANLVSSFQSDRGGLPEPSAYAMFASQRVASAAPEPSTGETGRRSNDDALSRYLPVGDPYTHHHNEHAHDHDSAHPASGTSGYGDHNKRHQVHHGRHRHDHDSAHHVHASHAGSHAGPHQHDTRAGGHQDHSSSSDSQSNQIHEEPHHRQQSHRDENQSTASSRGTQHRSEQHHRHRGQHRHHEHHEHGSSELAEEERIATHHYKHNMDHHLNQSRTSADRPPTRPSGQHAHHLPTSGGSHYEGDEGSSFFNSTGPSSPAGHSPDPTHVGAAHHGQSTTQDSASASGAATVSVSQRLQFSRLPPEGMTLPSVLSQPAGREHFTAADRSSNATDHSVSFHAPADHTVPASARMAERVESERALSVHTMSLDRPTAQVFAQEIATWQSK
jgi:hypothetical protein